MAQIRPTATPASMLQAESSRVTAAPRNRRGRYRGANSVKNSTTSASISTVLSRAIRSRHASLMLGAINTRKACRSRDRQACWQYPSELLRHHRFAGQRGVPETILLKDFLPHTLGVHV